MSNPRIVLTKALQLQLKNAVCGNIDSKRILLLRETAGRSGVELDRDLQGLRDSVWVSVCAVLGIDPDD